MGVVENAIRSGECGLVAVDASERENGEQRTRVEAHVRQRDEAGLLELHCDDAETDVIGAAFGLVAEPQG